MKTFKVVFNEDEDKGIYAVSLVENPAMEGMFIALNKQEPLKFSKIDEEQRILLGVALIPDKPIIRLTEEGEKFQIVFDKETIKKAAHAFFKNGFQNNSSLEHETKLSGVSFVESWIIEDAKNDKSRAYGIEEPEGSWMLSMKVDSDEIWKDFVKTGDVKGFSIDGLFSLEEINLKTDVNMSDNKEGKNALNDLKKWMVEFFSKEEKEDVKLGEAMLADESAIISYEGDSLEPGIAVFIQNEDERVPLPAGQYPLEDGRVLMVEEDGIVASISESEKEEEMEMNNDEVINQIKNLVATLTVEKDELAVEKDELVQLKKEVKEILDKNKKSDDLQLKEAKEKIEELEAKLAKTPSSKAIKHTDKKQAPVELTAAGRVLAKIRKNSNN